MPLSMSEKNSTAASDFAAKKKAALQRANIMRAERKAKEGY